MEGEVVAGGEEQLRRKVAVEVQRCPGQPARLGFLTKDLARLKLSLSARDSKLTLLNDSAIIVLHQVNNPSIYLC